MKRTMCLSLEEDIRERVEVVRRQMQPVISASQFYDEGALMKLKKEKKKCQDKE